MCVCVVCVCVCSMQYIRCCTVTVPAVSFVNFNVDPKAARAQLCVSVCVCVQHAVHQMLHGHSTSCQFCADFANFNVDPRLSVYGCVWERGGGGCTSDAAQSQNQLSF